MSHLGLIGAWKSDEIWGSSISRAPRTDSQAVHLRNAGQQRVAHRTYDRIMETSDVRCDRIDWPGEDTFRVDW